MLDRLKNSGWIYAPAFLSLPVAIWSFGAGPIGGGVYAKAMLGVLPVMIFFLYLIYARLEEPSWIDCLLLVCAGLGWLVLAGEATRLCPCGYQLPSRVEDGIIMWPEYKMHRCFTILLPLVSTAFAALLLPPYNRKTFVYRLAAFLTIMPVNFALSGTEALLDYRD